MKRSMLAVVLGLTAVLATFTAAAMVGASRDRGPADAPTAQGR